LSGRFLEGRKDVKDIPAEETASQ